ncbi:hypothetical protein BMYO_2001 [Bifidobacterium myosotis]|uniref:DUF3800 domain-containing protein n=1 Tax=Bifidobacterium myosotis TaxID=1630166 RepID=A0A261FDU2_9BIFI|nr:hypothetical protein BMYO_2001 [Bifidobacterium myosotis]
MSELSVFVDESGEWGKLSEYYLITLVFHVQSEPIAVHIEKYERHLADSGLPDIPFHAGPLFNGHDDYENVLFSNRKQGRLPDRHSGTRARRNVRCEWCDCGIEFSFLVSSSYEEDTPFKNVGAATARCPAG